MAVEAKIIEETPAPRRLPLAGFFRAFAPVLKTRTGLVGFLGVTLMLAMVIIGPIFVPFPAVSLDQVNLAPSWEHLLGTNYQGRDILALIINGGRDVMTVAFLTGIITTAIGVVMGSLAAYLGGIVDQIAMTIADVILSLPYLVLMAVLAGLVKLNNPFLLAGIMGLLFWPSLMRTVRAQVLTLRERDYVEAAVALNLGTRHIILFEILPNMASYIIINGIIIMTTAIYTQVGLAFLGLVPLSDYNWGLMINFARSQGALQTQETALFMMAPVITIALLQWFLMSLARSIEEVFNPRLKTGA